MKYWTVQNYITHLKGKCRSLMSLVRQENVCCWTIKLGLNFGSDAY